MDKLKEKLKVTFPEIFSGVLSRCKMSAKFGLKPNIPSVFKKEINVPFASLNQVDEESNRLEQIGVLSNVVYSEWASPTKKSKEIHVNADISTGLSNALKDYHYPIPSPEKKFAKLCREIYFSKIDLSDAYLRIHVDESARSSYV